MPTFPADHETAARAALTLAAGTRWRDLTLAQVCEAAGLTLTALYPMASPDCLIPLIDARFDRAMSGGRVEAEAVVRERLFDVIMRRFEAMETERSGVMSMLAHVAASPARQAAAFLRRQDSARWALACAGAEREGSVWLAPARRVGLALVMMQTEQAWLTEESADFSRTMQRLDKGLRDGEERLSTLRNPFSMRAGGPAGSDI
jgi:hypothetical protein